MWLSLYLSFLKFIELLECVDSYLLSNLGSVTIISSNILCAPSSLSFPYCTYVSMVVSYTSLRLCWVFFVLFSFCSSNWIFSLDLSSSLPFFPSSCSNLLLKPSSEFSFSYGILGFRIPAWLFFYHFYFYVNILFLRVVLQFSFTYLFMVSFSSLSIWKKIYLKAFF